MSYKITFEGFKSKEEVEDFLGWFSNAGDQDYFEGRDICINEEGKREYVTFDINFADGVVKVSYEYD